MNLLRDHKELTKTAQCCKKKKEVNTKWGQQRTMYYIKPIAYSQKAEDHGVEMEIKVLSA